VKLQLLFRHLLGHISESSGSDIVHSDESGDSSSVLELRVYGVYEEHLVRFCDKLVYLVKLGGIQEYTLTKAWIN